MSGDRAVRRAGAGRLVPEADRRRGRSGRRTAGHPPGPSGDEGKQERGGAAAANGLQDAARQDQTVRYSRGTIQGFLSVVRAVVLAPRSARHGLRTMALAAVPDFAALDRVAPPTGEAPAKARFLMRDTTSCGPDFARLDGGSHESERARPRLTPGGHHAS